MKSLTTTLSVFLMFGVILSLSLMFSSKTSEFNDILNRKFVTDRIYYKFDSIETSLLKIVKDIHKINVTIEEDDFINVTFQENLPKSEDENDDFESAADTFKSFVEGLPEANFLTFVNSTRLKSNMTLIVRPYNISYDHLNLGEDPNDPPDGLEFLKIRPQNPDYVEQYNIVVKIGDKNLDAGDTECSGDSNCDCTPPFSSGDLIWNITTIDKDDEYFNDLISLNYDDRCEFIITISGIAKRLNFTNDRNERGSLIYRARIQLGGGTPDKSPDLSISLNLTDIPGRTKVTLPQRIINIKETLYQIERNDTAYIH